jgi:hypothetical protein
MKFNTQKLSRLWLIAFLGFILLPYQNCGSGLHNLNEGSFSFSSTARYSELDSQIFQPKCTNCHDATAPPDFTSYSTLIAGSSVVAGNPGASSLYTQVASFQMPQGGALSATEISAIASWIAAGALPDGEIPPPMPPSPPSNLMASVASSSQINLTWIDNAGDEIGFKVERANSAAGQFIAVATLGSGMTNYSDTGLSANSTYYYRVYAYNNVGNSAFTAVANATTNGIALTPPNAPTNLSATATATQINLVWTDNASNETGFKIERAQSSGGPYNVIATLGAGATSYSNTGLQATTTYYYHVYAYNEAGISANSAVSATTLSPPAMGTFTWFNSTIIQPQCISCHSGSRPAGKYDMGSYTKVLTAIVPGNAANSLLYQRVLDGSMPKGAPDLTAQELSGIKTWIDNGAANN